MTIPHSLFALDESRCNIPAVSCRLSYVGAWLWWCARPIHFPQEDIVQLDIGGKFCDIKRKHLCRIPGVCLMPAAVCGYPPTVPPPCIRTRECGWRHDATHHGLRRGWTLPWIAPLAVRRGVVAVTIDRSCCEVRWLRVLRVSQNGSRHGLRRGPCHRLRCGPCHGVWWQYGSVPPRVYATGSSQSGTVRHCAAGEVFEHYDTAFAPMTMMYSADAPPHASHRLGLREVGSGRGDYFIFPFSYSTVSKGQGGGGGNFPFCRCVLCRVWSVDNQRRSKLQGKT